MTEGLCPGPTAAAVGVGVLVSFGRRMSVPLGLIDIDQRTILTMGRTVGICRNDRLDVWRDDVLARKSNGCITPIVSLRGENSSPCTEAILRGRGEIVGFPQVYD